MIRTWLVNPSGRSTSSLCYPSYPLLVPGKAQRLSSAQRRASLSESNWRQESITSRRRDMPVPPRHFSRGCLMSLSSLPSPLSAFDTLLVSFSPLGIGWALVSLHVAPRPQTVASASACVSLTRPRIRNWILCTTHQMKRAICTMHCPVHFKVCSFTACYNTSRQLHLLHFCIAVSSNLLTSLHPSLQRIVRFERPFASTDLSLR